ncbi:hypothetical protein TIFTF001_052040 [Ficus carica]|nr:hypothetical protein TIFTF001_052040 [Ficus carica]
MLENQIPIFVLKVILIAECSHMAHRIGIVVDFFPQILLGFCEYFSPLKTVENYPPYKALKHAHLLDSLYHLVTLRHSPEWNPEEEEEELRSIEELYEKLRSATRVPAMFPMHLQTARIGDHMIDLVKESGTFSAAAEEDLPKERLFPRASELNKAGVKFSVADHIIAIRFDPYTVTFYLPFIRLNISSEVIIRNLVAYDVMIKSEKEPLILNRYVDLMIGLIDTADDVKVLKGQGIISKPESISEE